MEMSSHARPAGGSSACAIRARLARVILVIQRPEIRMAQKEASSRMGANEGALAAARSRAAGAQHRSGGAAKAHRLGGPREARARRALDVHDAGARSTGVVVGR